MVQSQVKSLKEAFHARSESFPFLFRAFVSFPSPQSLYTHFNAKWLGNELVVVVFAFKVQSMGFLSNQTELAAFGKDSGEVKPFTYTCSG